MTAKLSIWAGMDYLKSRFREIGSKLVESAAVALFKQGVQFFEVFAFLCYFRKARHAMSLL